MKYQLKDVIDAMEFDELVRMRRDLKSGGITIRKMINSKIREHQIRHKMFCTTCSSQINLNNVNNYTLVFGPHDFRKKASFCGLDCLEYFMNELKNVKRVI